MLLSRRANKPGQSCPLIANEPRRWRASLFSGAGLRLKAKNPEVPAVKREAEKDWGKGALAISGTTRR